MAYPYGYTGYTPQYQQQYPQQPMQTPMQQQVQSPQHIVRPVASVEEARAVQTDFSGALTIMPDIDLSDYVPRTEFNELIRRFNKLCEQLGGANDGK